MKKTWIVAGVVVLIVLVAAGVYYATRQDDSGTTPEKQDTSQQEDANDGSVKQQEAPTVKDGISSTQAGNIAVQQYGGTVENVESSTYNDKAVWNVEIVDSPQDRIAVKVAQSDGTILAMEKAAPKD